MHKRANGHPVPSATNLPTSPKDDHANRQRNYLISMSFRTVCFVLAFFLHGWGRWVCVFLAFVLPYIAVVVANATNQRRIDVLGSVTPGRRPKQLPDDSEHPGGEQENRDRPPRA